MASIYDLKPRFQALLRPIANAFASVGLTANFVTVAALVLSILYGAAIYISGGSAFWLIGLPGFLFLRMALNAIDGMLAREHNQQSRLGAILNELSDVIADAALYLPFAIIGSLSPTLVVLVVVTGIAVEYAGVVAVQIGAERNYAGPFGKSDRAFFFGALALLIGLGAPIGPIGNGALIIALLLGILTIVNRSRSALKETGDG